MGTNLIDKPPFDLTGWEYVLTFGTRLDVYKSGNERIVINKDTGQIITKYEGRK